jgi:cysteinyl-tRNA synthetase
MAQIKIYNSLTRTKTEFVPRDPGKVTIYACGLTPQAPAHLGHMRGAVFFDAVRRWFIHRGYEVEFVQNFTDVDDKIINRAAEEGISAADVARKYGEKYLHDLEQLGVIPAKWVYVTENMDSIIEMVQRLIEKGYAYELDGDVYYSVEKFEQYGKLSGRKTDDMIAGARLAVDERKRDPKDFALWKAAKPGEPSWDSPWGPGRPGWHIECSALSIKYLGPGFDIHAGGADLKFPHHENEIAQSEAYLDGRPFARYWMHWGRVTLGGEKMSKSTGNVTALRDVVDRYSPGAIRLFLLGTSYTSELEFGYDRVDQAEAGVRRIQNAVRNAVRWLGDSKPEPSDAANSYIDRFSAAMDDDFNTAQALAPLFEAVSALNQLLSEAPSPSEDPDAARSVVSLLEAIRFMTGILGLPLDSGANAHSDELISGLIEKAIAWRARLRQQKQYELADMVREDLKQLGIVLEDSATGTTWKLES